MKQAANLEQLSQILEQAKTPMLVDFYADWCGPCKAISGFVEELARTYQGKVGFVQVNVDEAKDAAMSLGVRSMPTFLAFDKAQKVGEVSGANRQALAQLVSELASRNSSVFSTGAGQALGTLSGSSTFAAETRRNPWAEKDFVPPYMRNKTAAAAQGKVASQEEIMSKMEEEKRQKQNKLKQLVGEKEKPMSEMSKEEKLEYLEKLKAANRIQKQEESTQNAKEKEARRRERVKEALATKQQREQAAAEKAAKQARREKKEAKARRDAIKKKIADQKAALHQ